MRVKGGTTTRARRNKLFGRTKGYMGRQKNVWIVAKQADMKAGLHAYRGRKEKKRTYRALWIQRINAAVRALGLTYSRFIEGLTKAQVVVNRKNLADLATTEPKVFESLIAEAKKHLAGK